MDLPFDGQLFTSGTVITFFLFNFFFHLFKYYVTSKLLIIVPKNKYSLKTIKIISHKYIDIGQI